MKRVSSQIITTLLAFIFCISCKKRDSSHKDFLTGTWIKGANAGDTLQFLKKSNKNILRYRVSFNPTPNAYKELEYRYRNGKLDIKKFSPGIDNFYPINSFVWKQTGSEFELQGIELFLFLSSTQVRFTYRKI